MQKVIVNSLALDGVIDTSSVNKEQSISTETGLIEMRFENDRVLDAISKGEETELLISGEYVQISQLEILTVSAILESIEVLERGSQEEFI